MVRSTQDRFEQWKIGELLEAYPGLRVQPIVNGQIRLSGALAFGAETNGHERIDDTYEVEISVPYGFPRHLPRVRETGGRIPKDFHTNHDGCLCLGSPARLHLELKKAPTLPGFVKSCLIPYLYGYSYREKHGRLPFGELEHGMKGIRNDFAALFGVASEQAAKEMVRLAGMKKRVANKQPCPCGSRRRLGKCHNRVVHRLRNQLGRKFFRDAYRRIN